MNAVKNENYSMEPIDDAREILEAYKKLPDNKKPMLMVIINALISGMEIQEILAGKQRI